MLFNGFDHKNGQIKYTNIDTKIKFKIIYFELSNNFSLRFNPSKKRKKTNMNIGNKPNTLIFIDSAANKLKNTIL